MTPQQTRTLSARRQRPADRRRKQAAVPQQDTTQLSELIQRAEQAPESLAASDVMVLQRALGNQATADVIQRITSNKIVLEEKGNDVAKAPTDMANARWKSRTIIDKLALANFPGQAGTVTGCEGDEKEVRIDKQGEYNGGGRRWINIQAQANEDDNGNYNDLVYPPRTRTEQKGTTLGEVHVDDRLVGDDKADVINRTARLIKQGLYKSIGQKANAARKAYKVYSPE